MSREQFEKWAVEQQMSLLPSVFCGSTFESRATEWALRAWSARQTEIDALKDDLLVAKENWENAHADLIRKEEHIAALKAEVEQLRKDSERLEWLEAHPRIGEIHVDGEVKDCYLYAVSGALGVPLRTIIDTIKETK